MFETAELGRRVSKEELDAQLPELRSRLLEAQFALRDKGRSVVLIISGADGAGKGETVNRLHEWLDTRGLETAFFGPLSDEERDRPPYWRFWRALPARGRIGILFGSWYTSPIIRRVYGETKTAPLDAAMERIVRFEEMLVADGTLLLKFWLHLSKKEQRKRIRRLAKDPATRWRVSPVDEKHLGLYDEFRKVAERSLRRTDSAAAPWFVVEATDDAYRDLTVARTLLEALEGCVAGRAVAVPPAVPRLHAPARPPGDETAITLLDRVDLTKRLSPRKYERQLADAQSRLNKLTRRAWKARRSTVVVFEGWDAAGKGSAIRRLTAAMDARLYRVISIAAPTDEERAHHYLWRFWRHVPRAGYVTVYDRSWYGRVLVERVEGFCREEEWARAYSEINDFEEQLGEHGIVLVKLWLHIGKDEQLRRFQERQETAYKRHKITDEDWRNREKWPLYEAAVADLAARTSTALAPWTLVPANDKRHARIEVLHTVCDRIEAALSS